MEAFWSNQIEFLYRTVHPKIVNHYRAGPFRRHANFKTATPKQFLTHKCKMDLHTIKKRMEAFYYKNADEVVQAYRKMFQIARKCNVAGSSTHKASIILEKAFEKALKRMPSGPEVRMSFTDLLEDWKPVPKQKKVTQKPKNPAVPVAMQDINSNPKENTNVANMAADYEFQVKVAEMSQKKRENRELRDAYEARKMIEEERVLLERLRKENRELRNQLAIGSCPQECGFVASPIVVSAPKMIVDDDCSNDSHRSVTSAIFPENRIQKPMIRIECPQSPLSTIIRDPPLGRKRQNRTPSASRMESLMYLHDDATSVVITDSKVKRRQNKEKQ